MQWQKNLWVLSIAAFLANISFTLMVPFLPVFLVELGLKDNLSWWSGIIISVNFLTYALMAPVWGSLADRYGKRIMFIRSGLGIALTLVLMGLAANHWQLFILRALNGFLSGFIPSAIMLVASNTPEDKMGYSLGILNAAIAVGGIMGPFVGGGLVEYIGIRPVLFLAAAILCFASVLAYWGTRESNASRTVRTSIRQDLAIVMGNRSLRLYFFCFFVLQAAIMMVLPILPLRIAELSTVRVELVTGAIFSVVGISLAIGSPLVCRIKNISYNMILLNGLLFCAISCLLQGLTYSLVWLGLLRFLFGFAHAAVNVSGNVLITQCAGADFRGRVFGVLNSITAFGMVLGPLIGGMLGESLGNSWAFYGSALLFGLAAYLVWQDRERGVDVIETEELKLGY